MKTAVSISNDIFGKAEKVAKKLGLSRSELYAMAIESFVEPLLADEVTKTLDEVYVNEPSSIDNILKDMQIKSLHKGEW